MISRVEPATTTATVDPFDLRPSTSPLSAVVIAFHHAMTRSLLLALQLLTRLPLPALKPPPRTIEFGWATLWFPLVGLLIGVFLVGLHRLLGQADLGVQAALILTVWVLLTGGLHLDGLADTADAWIGGQGDRARTLEIMKDPRSGPLAIVVITLALLLKFAALRVLLASDGLALLLTPLLGRSALLLLLRSTPYVRADGLGAPYAQTLPRWPSVGLILLIVIATLALLAGTGAILCTVLGLGLAVLRRQFIRRLGGITGDTLGATCELIETLALLTLALWSPGV